MSVISHEARTLRHVCHVIYHHCPTLTAYLVSVKFSLTLTNLFLIVVNETWQQHVLEDSRRFALRRVKSFRLFDHLFSKTIICVFWKNEFYSNVIWVMLQPIFSREDFFTFSNIITSFRTLLRMFLLEEINFFINFTQSFKVLNFYTLGQYLVTKTHLKQCTIRSIRKWFLKWFLK